jgi:tRNA 2-thiocytidine biosynthesis protein TtcA
LRDIVGDLEKEHPFLKETLLSAMGKVETGRLLDTRFLDLDGDRSTSHDVEPEHDSPLVSILS